MSQLMRNQLHILRFLIELSTIGMSKTVDALRFNFCPLQDSFKSAF